MYLRCGRVFFATVFMVLAIIVSQSVIAQDDEPQIEPTELPDTQDIIPNFASQWIAAYDEFDFAELNTIYMIDPSAIPEVQYAAPDTFLEVFSAQTAFSWDEVEQATQGAVDILIIHESAIRFIDQSWTNAAYRNGTIIIGISMSFEEIAAIVGDQCLQNENLPFSAYFEEWFYFPVYWSRSDPAEGQPIVDADTLDNCSERFDGLAGAAITHGLKSRPFVNEASFDYLVKVIKADIVSRKLQGILMPSQGTPLPIPPAPAN